MIIKNGRIHDGKGKVFPADLRLNDGKIAEIAEHIDAPDEEVFDASGMEILPGFIQALSFWGINGSSTEIRPSSNDNNELSDPITPQLDVKYAFNGRAATVQQLGAFGLTTVGVTPTDNNLFGGTMAVFEVDGVNPFAMCVKPCVGMKASATSPPRPRCGSSSSSPNSSAWPPSTRSRRTSPAT